jgi:alpha-1,2-mannosyltransferase
LKKPISFAKTLIPLGISICFFFFYCWAQGGPTSAAKNDFINVYVSGKLACTGNLFSVPAMLEWHKTILGGTMPNSLSLRPPYYALAVAPLARLPYQTAYAVFLGLDVLAILGFVLLMRKRSPAIALTCSLCLPLLLGLGNGQDVPILIFLFALSIHFLDRGEDFIAGMVLSLCSFKGQFFVLIPLVLLLRHRWRYFLGGVAGAGVLAGLSFVAGGAHWIGEYRELLSRPDNNPTPWQMGNIHAFADGLNGGAILQFALVGVAVAVFLWMIVREKNLDVSLGLAILAGLLISPHGYMQDFSLMLPASVLLESRLQAKIPRTLKQALMSPFPYLAAMFGPPFSLLLPTTALGLFASLTRKEPDPAAASA